jgi:hypothetical protein
MTLKGAVGVSATSVTVTVYEPAAAVETTTNPADPADMVFAAPVTEQKADPGEIMFAGAVDIVHAPVVEKPPPVIEITVLGGPLVGDRNIPATTVNAWLGDTTDFTYANTVYAPPGAFPTVNSAKREPSG